MPLCRSTIALIFVLATVCANAVWTRTTCASEPGESPPFESTIFPVLKRHCLRCHGSETHRAELDLSTEAGLRKGSESGAVIDREFPEQSRLLQLLGSGEMPPEGEPRPTQEEIDTIRSWVLKNGGAPKSDSDGGLSQAEILQILALRCVACHGRQKQEGGLDVRTRASLLKGGASGPAIVLGDADGSRLVQRISSGEMPPKKQLAAVSVKPVEDRELRKITAWIAAGAPELEITADVADGMPDRLLSDSDRDFWSFKTPRLPSPPTMSPLASRNPIDQFIAEKLHQQRLEFSPRADPRTLLRRISFDLIGLPPSDDQLQRLTDAADFSSSDLEMLIDELLASPAYGERWAQYWLDLAGYSDSEGVQDSDPIRPAAYRYRDYVIQSWNRDKPYDQFVHEQLAGDELADYESAPEITHQLYDNLVATAFLGMSPDGTFAGITGFVPNRLDVIDDQLKSVGAAFLGLTIGCARCHSHKFDAIPQRDYYRLAAVFKGALDEHDWLKPTRQGSAPGVEDRYLPWVTTAERMEWERNDKPIQEQLEPLRKQREQSTEDAEKKALDEQIKKLESQRTPQPVIRALWDRGEPSPTYLLSRGDYLRPTRLVGPGLPSVLTDGQSPFVAIAPWPGAKKTGRRLAFARWLTSVDHPLTARVFVNRVWKHHFGQGIVSSLDNFGRVGDPPSHPELLDWLAVELIRHNWSIKWLHRVILTSSTYQQQSRMTEQLAAVDPDNRWLGRMPLRRLDAESLRDTLYEVAGKLNRRRYGPADSVEARADGLVTPASGTAGSRRSIYMLQRRSQPLTILADFDRPAMSPNCVARVESTVAPQALHLLNSQTVYELGQSFADRLMRAVGEDPRAQIDLAYRITSGRSPDEVELSAGLEAIAQLAALWRVNLEGESGASPREADRRALASYCHAMLNSASLIFVE